MKGSCHCGAIKFEVVGTPSWVGACHCKDCQKSSGAPHTVFAEFNASDLEILEGTARAYRSSEKVMRSFCQKCGSPIMYVHDGNADKVEMPIGIFDEPEVLAPQQHIWISQKLPWDIICDSLPQSDKD